MTRRDVDLPVDERLALDVLSLLSRKWHPVVLAVLDHHGAMGFNALLEAIPDVSGKVLSGTLEELVDAELIERTVVSEAPLRVEYELTDAGRDMRPIFEALAAWGGHHLESATPHVLLADSDRRLTDLYSRWLVDRYTVARAHDGDELDATLDDTIDVVIFDEGLPGADPRRIPETAGERCRTIALVSDRPGTELLEIDCDAVLRKPIVRETALEAIDEQLRRQGEPEPQRERASLAARLSVLESIYPHERLVTTDAYLEARDRLQALETRLEE